MTEQMEMEAFFFLQDLEPEDTESTDEPKVKHGKRKEIKIGGIPMPVYMMPNGEYRWSMRQASKAVGYNEGWLRDTIQAGGNALIKLQGYGFKGKIVESSGQGFIKSHLVSTEDFMAVILYAVMVGYQRPAIALMAAAMQETLERRADHAFGVVRDEDEYIQKFEYRYASILLNKDLRQAITEWIENNQHNIQNYTKTHSIRGGYRGIYASALGEIYQVLFGRNKAQINQFLDVAAYRTPKDNVNVNQLQRIAQIEDLAAKYIQRKGLNPIEAIRAAAGALMIELEEPKLGDRVTRQDVHRVLDAKKSSKKNK
ncbi:hypothetical protein I8752_11450 [Nostocaceae cyanobacterium CENA369]|uniref:Uncharacterized protein n=1 Tax=Dendronalium phyllosphericum CENA369 TaxID=1725256 RepID=A0A8J7I4Z7_9NOST|nr:hypothetical protein [Dendronalium phyllosphericum]MBH8573620.1 hypothetical protein [Dendronalium phyllosphericum CENA369]